MNLSTSLPTLRLGISGGNSLKRSALGTILAAGLIIGLGACSGSDENATGPDGQDSSDSITVVYQRYGGNKSLEDLLTRAKDQVEADQPGKKVELVPIEADSNGYFTKLALMNQSGSEAPDVMYEDSFMVKTDADAGYLAPLDDYLAEWPDWDQYLDNAKEAGQGTDGKTYGVSLSTDTRAIWFNKEIFAQAGLDPNWQPKDWAEILETAETIKDKVPGVIPLNVFSGKTAGEAASMQGFEMLLYGTKDTLYDAKTQKWVTGSKGFADSLEFIRTIYQEGLAPTPQQALDSQIDTVVATNWMPEGKVAMAIHGSWIPGAWLPGQGAEWPEWEQVMATAKMPTQTGASPNFTSMSGGHTLAIGAQSKAPRLAMDFLEAAFTQEQATTFVVESSGIAVRQDVIDDPAYQKSDSSFGVLSDVVEVTHFRPATSEYPEVSNNIQIAMEAVMTGDKSVKEAVEAYDAAVTRIVGKENTTAGK